MVLKYKKLLKTSTAVILTTGGGWVYYQIYRTKDAINHIVNTDILQIKKSHAEYIYVTNPEISDEMYIQNQVVTKPSISQWWKSWQHSLAWRLLAMAQTGNRSDRLHAVRSLVEMKNMKDSDYRQLAQACDARTAVGLARSKDVDLRFFLKPPYAHISFTRQELIEDLHDLLITLNEERHHPCLEYFLNKAFPDFQNRHKMFDHDNHIEPPQSVIKGEDLLPLCLKNLVHHSALEENGKDIVTLGGLVLLMAVYRHCSMELDILVLLAKLLANISVYHELLDKLYRTGWIGVLAEWAKHPDIRLSAPAAKTLANLDSDDLLHGLYLRRIYLLHPTCRSVDPVKLDVVFVHGLLGGVFVTWRQRDHTASDKEFEQLQIQDGTNCTKVSDVDEMEEWEAMGHDFEVVLTDSPENTNGLATGPYCVNSQHQCVLQDSACSSKHTQCWPVDWLAVDRHNLRVLGVNYETSLSMWGPICPAESVRRSLVSRSEELLQKLYLAGVGQRPVVWVTHSMGGLLVKNILVKAWESGNAELQSMCNNTKAVVFYSVPHLGSPLAALTPATQLLLSPTVEVQELRENSPALLSLHVQFLEMINEIPFDVVSFVETKPTLIPALRLQFTFVPISSADPGIGELYEIPQDHLSICKPASRQSFLYQKLIHIIDKILEAS